MQLSSPHSALGIRGIATVQWFTRNLDQSRQFFAGLLDFAETGASTTKAEAQTGQRLLLFEAGACRILCVEPLQVDTPAGRYLRRHPEGIGAISFDVDDVHAVFHHLDARGGTPISDIHWERQQAGELGWFAIATPLPDVHLHFVERAAGCAPAPGLRLYHTPRGGGNLCGFRKYDHITCNHQTMAPALLWLEHVLGLVRHWDIEFHTLDVAPTAHAGSGLRSVVMRDPDSGIKFANNEPLRPQYHDSQVSTYCDAQRGAGVQHVAIEVDDIIAAVTRLRQRGGYFVHTPHEYYQQLQAHLDRRGVGRIDEDLRVLQDLEILADGQEPGRYLLQIFMADAAHLTGDPNASPFFFELIQRKGADGFGAGNFRALFESIELSESRPMQ